MKMYSNHIVSLKKLMLVLLHDKLELIEKILNLENSKLNNNNNKIVDLVIYINILLKDEMDENNEMLTLDILNE